MPAEEGELLNCQLMFRETPAVPARCAKGYARVDIHDLSEYDRAGWLCDTFFTARAEHFFFGDTPIEDAFLENYLPAPLLKSFLKMGDKGR